MKNKLKVLIMFLFTFILSVLYFYGKDAVKAIAPGCIPVYNYGSGAPCSRAPDKAAWLRSCSQIPGCNSSWWFGTCWGPWNDVDCAYAVNGVATCPTCGNTVSCPVITKTPTPTPTKTNTPTPTPTKTNTPTPTLTKTPTPTLTLTPTPTVFLTPAPIACGGTGCNTTPCQTGFTCVSNKCQLSCNASQFQEPGNICSCIDLPTCKTADLKVLNNSHPVEPIYQGDNVVLQYNPTPDPLSTYKIISNNVSPNPFTPSCTPSKLSDTQTLCKIPDDYPVLTTQPIIWTNKYQYCNNTYSTYCSPVCQESTTFNANQTAGYLKTSLGSVYVRGKDYGLLMPNFPTNFQFAKYVLATNLPNFSTYKPLSSYLSTYNYLSKSYNNTNSNPTTVLKNKIIDDSKFSKKVLPAGNHTFDDLNLNADNNNLYIISNSTDDATLTIDNSAFCKKSAIIITNNLIINKNFELPANPVENAKSGCVFVVVRRTDGTQGQTTIGPDVTKVDAFIITDKYTSQNGINLNGYVIKGGLTITNTDPSNSNFLRTIYSGGDTSKPSEEIIYEGARYVKLFKDLFPQATTLSIRETQFNQ